MTGHGRKTNIYAPFFATTDLVHGGAHVVVDASSRHTAERPESVVMRDLAEWFRKRVGTMAGRTRRIAIVAMARKLLISLWRYVETGTILAGQEFGSPAMTATA